MELLQILKFSHLHILIMPQFNLFWIAWKQFISNLTFVPWLVNTVPVHLTLTFALFVRKRGGTKQPKRYALQEWLC